MVEEPAGHPEARLKERQGLRQRRLAALRAGPAVNLHADQDRLAVDRSVVDLADPLPVLPDGAEQAAGLEARLGRASLNDIGVVRLNHVRRGHVQQV